MKMLVVIDMQNDFINMALGTKEAQGIVPVVADKIKNIRYGDIVVTTCDTHYNDYLNTLEGKKLPVKHCIMGTEGWELNEEVRKELEAIDSQTDRPVWINVTKNTFGYLKWEEILNRFPIDEIEICGLCTDICVISNALILRAMRPNMKITIDHTACAGVTPEAHEAALAVAKSCQIDVI